MFTRRLSVALASLLLGFISLSAQSVDVKVGDETIKITPMGRFYFDGAMYLDDETDLGNGVALTDLRLGLKAKYKMFDIKADIGFAGGEDRSEGYFPAIQSGKIVIYSWRSLCRTFRYRPYGKFCKY